MSAAEKPAAAAFHSDRFEMRYVWMCSGLFSSSANGASASRASAYFGLSTSTSTVRSDWTMNGFAGSKLFADGPADCGSSGVFLIFVGMITVDCRQPGQVGAERLMLPPGARRGQAEVTTRVR